MAFDFKDHNRQAYYLLQATFVIAPIVAGLEVYV